MNKKQILEKRGEATGAILALRELVSKEDREMTGEERTNFTQAQADEVKWSAELDLVETTERIGKEFDSFDQDRSRGPAGDVDEETRCLAFQAQFSRGEHTEEQRKALARCGLQRDSDGRTIIILPRHAPNSLAEARLSLATARETRVFATSPDNVGGSTIPTIFMRELEVARLAFGPMLQHVRLVRTDSGAQMDWPTENDTTAEGAWGDEAATITVDDATPFGDVTLNSYKWNSKIIKVNEELFEDSAFDMASETGRMIGGRWGRGELARATTGTGTGQHNGIVTAATKIDSVSATVVSSNDPINLLYSIDPAYRDEGRFVAHSDIIKLFHQLKDTTGQFIWQPSYRDGLPPTLIGRPVVYNNKMASTIAEDANILLYGDLSKYLLREVRSMRLYRLNELYRANDQTGFVGLIRGDGDLLDAGTNPVKCINVIAAGS